MGLLRSAAAALIDFPLPPRCPGCGVVVDGDGTFCAGCWGALDFLPGEGCDACNAPVPIAGMRCARCLQRPPRHDRVLAAVAYGDPSRHLVLALKHGRRIGHARTIARFLLPQARQYPDALLVPVPLHRWRIFRRGFNQSVLIARHIARTTGQGIAPDGLTRTRATAVLGGLGARERAKAVQGAFAVRDGFASAIRGRTVLLVDDVYTSGATANACAATLKKAGAAHVHVLCWARVLVEAERTY